MIAKHVPMKTKTKSSFAGLAEYITDSQSKEHRLGIVNLTNCQSSTLDAAVDEVLATQHMNKRATGDKTYHLILSFRAGESLDPELLKIIEERVCSSLGFSEHQRISAVHNDTDNLHVHIAINKIHPEKNTMHEPYKAFKTLADICEKIELDYGLERDNHISKNSISQGKVQDMERHSGIESLSTWIKNECLIDIKAASSWEQLHEVMQDNGLSIKPRGNGLIIESIDSGLAVKPSTVSRELSKGALEKRLGLFEQSHHAPKKAKRTYKERPIELKGVNTVELYAKYKDYQEQYKVNQVVLLTSARQGKDSRIKDIKASNKMRRQAIKLMGGSAISKRILYAQASSSMLRQIKKANEDFKQERSQIYTENKRETWADWLKSEAVKGDNEAVAALRARSKRDKYNTLKGEGNKSQTRSKPKDVDSITKKGTFILRGKAAIKDDGQRFRLEDNASQETFREALVMASEKYGNKITVTGSALFKAQAVQAAVDSKLQISFADPVLEARRQKLLTENNHERTTDRLRSRRSISNDGGRPGNDRVRSGRGTSYAGRGGVADGGGSGQRPGRGTGAEPGQLFNKPDVARVGAKPPPESQNRLRGLSQLGLVHFTDRSEVLLPRDVPSNVEQQGEKPNNELRRNISGGGSVAASNNQLIAADKYISEREEKRAKGFDIPQHMRYNGEIDNLSFAGLRKVGNEDLALIKSSEKILVMSVNSATASKLKRIKVGSPLSINDRGVVQAISGRSTSRK